MLNFIEGSMLFFFVTIRILNKFVFFLIILFLGHEKCMVSQNVLREINYRLEWTECLNFKVWAKLSRRTLLLIDAGILIIREKYVFVFRCFPVISSSLDKKKLLLVKMVVLMKSPVRWFRSSVSPSAFTVCIRCTHLNRLEKDGCC